MIKEVRDYSSFMSDLRQLSGAVAEKIWVSPMSSYAVFSATGNNKVYNQPPISCQPL